MGRFRFCKREDPEDTTSGWRQAAPPGKESKHDAGWRDAQQAVSEVLECDHVAVLSGLGTSLCIPSADEKTSLFPTMGRLWAEAEDAVTSDHTADVLQRRGEKFFIEQRLQDAVRRHHELERLVGKWQVTDVAADQLDARSEPRARTGCCPSRVWTRDSAGPHIRSRWASRIIRLR